MFFLHPYKYNKYQQLYRYMCVHIAYTITSVEQRLNRSPVIFDT